MNNTISEQCAPYENTSLQAQRAMFALLIAVLSLVLVGCGSVPIERTEYTRVEGHIADAKEIKASEHAGGELYAAQEKLKDARAAEEAGRREQALRLINEAGLHARLAESRARTARAQDSLDEVNAGLETLEMEINR